MPDFSLFALVGIGFLQGPHTCFWSAQSMAMNAANFGFLCITRWQLTTFLLGHRCLLPHRFAGWPDFLEWLIVESSSVQTNSENSFRKPGSLAEPKWDRYPLRQSGAGIHNKHSFHSARRSCCAGGSKN
jgi:hypothetical protein